MLYLFEGDLNKQQYLSTELYNFEDQAKLE